MIRLTAVIEVEGQAPRAVTHEAAGPRVVIGRDSSADFQIPLSTISRQHAIIHGEDGLYTIEDLGSTHGTILNGRRLVKGEKKVLKNGDVIELTKAKITCSFDDEKAYEIPSGEGTQAVAAKSVQRILDRMGTGRSDGPFLRVLNGADEGTKFKFADSLSEWSIGRSKDCEFVLNDRNVSRRHAVIRKDWSGFLVSDLGSKNGVIVNDHPIKKPKRLKDRDELTIGPIKLVFVDPDAELLAALKDVPGFTPEESGEVAAIDAAPSVMGAPAEDGELPPGDGSEGPPMGDELSADSPQPEPMDGDVDEASAAEAIDPELLTPAPSRSAVEWALLGLGAVVVLAAIVLLFAILSPG